MQETKWTGTFISCLRIISSFSSIVFSSSVSLFSKASALLLKKDTTLQMLNEE